MKSALCESLGIKIPIIQAPMGGADGPELAGAVSNAGGLGMLALWPYDVDIVRETIRATKALTDLPFGVNLNMQFPQDKRLDVCLEEKVQVISFFWGDPSNLIDRTHEGHAVVLHTCASAKEARKVVDDGVDIVVAQGWEAGGHVRGTVSTLPLIPAVVNAVSPTPVVAAGGIADGRGLAAAMALGADGVWIGTRFLASYEAAVHPRYQKLLLGATEDDTCHTQLFDIGWPNASHRVLRNKTVDIWEAAGRPPSGARPGENEVIAKSRSRGDIVRYRSFTPANNVEGDIDALSLWSGQSVGIVADVKSVSAIMSDIVREAGEILKNASNRFDD